ncbi:hypothetical protein BH09PAT2_BH09PAT2_02210 [soil metagenome]
MLQRLRSFISDPTSGNIIINTIGTFINVFFVAIFAVILFRLMPISQYGALSVLLGIAYVLANVLEFGTTATIYSYVPGMHTAKDPKLYRFIKSTFYYQSIFSAVIIVLLFILFPYLDKVFFKTNSHIITLYLTALSSLFFIWQNFFTNILFAAKKFYIANLYVNIANIFKTVLIGILALTGYLSVGVVILVFGIIGPAVFFLLIFLKNRKLVPLFYKAAIVREDFKFNYTMTYFIASQFYNLGTRMDLFLLSYFALKFDVGYYGLSQKIILSIIATIVSITQVLSPRFATINTKKEALKEFKTSILYMLIPSAIFVALYFTPTIIFKLAFSNKAVPIVSINKSLAIAYFLNALGSIPLLFLLYTAKKPIYILYSNIAFFIIVSIGSYWLIPQKGVHGPPLAILAAFIVATAWQTIAMIYEYRKLKD